MKDMFSLENKVCVITGGAGFLAHHVAGAFIEHGASIVLLDLDDIALQDRYQSLIHSRPAAKVLTLRCDITNEQDVSEALLTTTEEFGRVDILINAAANNPALQADATLTHSYRVEDFPMNIWERDLAVGITGAFLCAKHFGSYMSNQQGGVIINIASDLALISPDQRLYEIPGRAPDAQPVKPITYSVSKSAMLGLTRYLATYWASKNVRVNAVAFGGIENGQPQEFLQKVSNLIPLGRLARSDEYSGTLVYLCSDAASYVNGATIVVDGGRTIW